MIEFDDEVMEYRSVSVYPSGDSGYSLVLARERYHGLMLGRHVRVGLFEDLQEDMKQLFREIKHYDRNVMGKG